MVRPCYYTSFEYAWKSATHAGFTLMMLYAGKLVDVGFREVLEGMHK